MNVPTGTSPARFLSLSAFAGVSLKATVSLSFSPAGFALRPLDSTAFGALVGALEAVAGASIGVLFVAFGWKAERSFLAGIVDL